MKITKGLLICILGATVLLSACGTTTLNKRITERMTPEQMQAYAKSVLSAEEMKLFSVPYDINAEVKQIALNVETFGRTKYHQGRQLAVLLLAGGDLGISYKRNSNFTAMEVYDRRTANCISYTNLFIGMARALRINARYAEVNEVDSFEKYGDTVVYNSHICAVIFDGPKPFLIDFSLTDNPQYHLWRSITDLEAVAGFYNNIGSDIFLERKSPDFLDEAARYLNISRKLYPDSPQTYNNIGVIELEKGNIDEAERQFRRALDIKPGYFAAYNNLGSIYMRRGKIDESIRLVQEAIVASPGNKYAYNTLAKLYMRQENYASAENNLRKALRIDKRYTEARHELGKLYLKLGRGDEALEQFALAIKFKPEDDIARNKLDLIRQLQEER